MTTVSKICISGGIETRPTQIIDEETLVPDYPRVVFRFDRRNLAKLRMLIDREPRPLYGILNRNGYTYDATLRDDSIYEILIRTRG